MAKEPTHEGTRSWWDGSVTTLCGLKFSEATRRWFATTPTCPTCKRLKK